MEIVMSIAAPISNIEKFLMNQRVLIIHEYPIFGLSKVRYENDDEEFIIDSKSLTSIPSKEHTISIQLLGRL